MRRRTTMRTLALMMILGASPALAEVRDPAMAEAVGRLNNVAREAISAGDFSAALGAYREAAKTLEGDPGATDERSRALFLVAVCLERLQRPAEAMAAHREALDAGLTEPLAGKARSRIAKLEMIVSDDGEGPGAESATKPPSPARPATAPPIPAPQARPEPADPVATEQAPAGQPVAESTGAEAPPAEPAAAIQPAAPSQSEVDDARAATPAPARREADDAKAAQPAPMNAKVARPAAVQNEATAAPDAAAQTAAKLAALDAQAKAAVSARSWATAATAYREAAELLGTLPDRRSEQATTWFLVGFCLDRLDRQAEAELAYEQSRALGPPDSILRRIEARVGVAPAATMGARIELACVPTDLSVSVQGIIDAGPCAALQRLPAGVWRIEGRGADGRQAARTVRVVPDTGVHHFSLVAPPMLEPPPPEPDHRRAWVLTLSAAVTAGAGGALWALDQPNHLGPEARPIGTGLLAVGGVLAAVAVWSWVDPPNRAQPAAPIGLGPSGFTF